MSAQPTWFDGDGPLFGWVHAPGSGTCRAGVVLCPGVGRDLTAGYASFRRLAEACAAAGLLTLRFDYARTGDSSGGLESPGAVEAWHRSIDGAVAFVRGLGCERVALVGMRLGATLAAGCLAAGTAADALLLWDPHVSGRAALRHERALYGMIFDGAAVPFAGAEAPGYRYGPDVVDGLAGYNLAALPPRIWPRTHLMVRSDRPHQAVVEHATGHGATAETLAPGIDLMDVLLQQASTPLPGQEEAQRWLVDRFAAEAPTAVRVSTRAAATVSGPDGQHVAREEAVYLGAAGVFGIRTSSIDTHPVTGSPTIVFLNVSDEHHIGPARQWVELARRLAEDGLTSIRVDLPGFGDTPPVPGRSSPRVYAPEVIQDAKNLVAVVGDGDPSRVVLVGLCSSAYTAIEVGCALDLAGVCAVNPVLDIHLPADDAEPRDALTPKRRWVSRIQNSWLGRRARRNLPEAAWWAIDALHIQRSPARGLLPLAARSGDVLVVCGEDDSFRLTVRGSWIIRRLSRSPRFTLVLVSGLDHAAVVAAARERLANELRRHLTTRFANPDLPARVAAERSSSRP